MAPHGARASTSTMRIKFTHIEETFQCLPEHMSIMMPRQKWIQLGDQHCHRGWHGTSWGQGIHEHNEDQIHTYRRDISMFTRAHEHTDASTEVNPVRRSALSPWMTWHLMGPGQPRSQWGSTSMYRRDISMFAYWGHWQNHEHMSILRPLTELN